MASRSTATSARSASASSAISSMNTSGWPSTTVSPGATAIARTMPLARAATTCSIFIASITRTSAPARTDWPSRTATLTMVPCIGATTATVFSGPAMAGGTPATSTWPTAAAAPDVAAPPSASGAAAALLPWTSTASGSPRSTRAPTWPRAAGASAARRCDAASAATSPAACASTKPVCRRPARSSGCRRSAWRKPMLVGAPTIRNSASARWALAATSRRSTARVDTITLASSESKREPGRYPA